MLSDYKVFTSYRRLTDKHATVGDDIKVRINGSGIAIYQLNSKVIKTCNVLR